MRYMEIKIPEITIRDGKGMKDRVTILPEIIEKHLQQHLEKAKIIHTRDLTEGYNDLYSCIK